MARHERTPWAIDIIQVSARPGNSTMVDTTFHAPSGIGDAIVGVDEGSDVTLKASLSCIVDGLVLSGHITAPVHAECTRCLAPISRDWEVGVTAFFPYRKEADGSAHGKGTTHDIDGDVDIIAGEEETEDVYPLGPNETCIDVQAMLRDTLVEALPLQPLCRKDCRGLCPQCGIDLNDDPTHAHEVTDGRFDVLAQLKERLEREQEDAGH